METVSVVFNPNYSSKYTYLVPPDDDPQIGDIVVTSTNSLGPYPNSGRYDSDLKAAKVVALNEDKDKGTRYYLQLIPQGRFEEVRRWNKRQAEQGAKIKAARSRLDQLAEKEDKLEVYYRLAERSEEASRLVAYLKSVGEI